MSKLKPCPFCGGEAKLISLPNFIDNRYRHFVTCVVCGVETPRTTRIARKAIEAWNRRVNNA